MIINYYVLHTESYSFEQQLNDTEKNNFVDELYNYLSVIINIYTRILY